MACFAYQPEGLIAASIFFIVSSVAFAALQKTEIGIWWSLLLAVVFGGLVIALMFAFGLVMELIERCQSVKSTRREGQQPPGGP